MKCIGSIQVTALTFLLYCGVVAKAQQRSEREPTNRVLSRSDSSRLRGTHDGTERRQTKEGVADSDDVGFGSLQDFSLSNDQPDKPKKSDEKRLMRMIVRYTNANGRQQVLSVVDSVVKDRPKKKLLVVEMDQEARDLLESYKKIKVVEVDSHYEAFGQRQVGTATARELRGETTPWGIRMIEADQLDVGSYPVKVCIIDTGFAVGHPDLPSRVTGDNAISKFGDVWDWQLDFNGHGTHIGGIMAAVGDNDVGVTGVGAIPLHITRGLDDYSDGFESDILDAIDQCVDAGAKIINLSLGGNTMSTASEQTYTRLVNDLGILVVAAAGNQGSQREAYPASHPDVISVAAVYEWGNYWEGSNYGPQVELSAPGHNILSTTTTQSAVHTSDFSYTATSIPGTRRTEREGWLRDCNNGSYVCDAEPNGVPGGICIMARDQTHLRTMLNNCERGGGIAAIVFDAKPLRDQDSTQARVRIPAIFVPAEVGIELLSYVGQRVSVGHRYDDEVEYTYEYFQGTSMATPHVAAAAALVWSHFPSCTNHEIRYALDVTAYDKGLFGCDWDYGFGIVKVKRAYDWLVQNPCGNGNFGAPHRGGGCLTV